MMNEFIGVSRTICENCEMAVGFLNQQPQMHHKHQQTKQHSQSTKVQNTIISSKNKQSSQSKESHWRRQTNQIIKHAGITPNTNCQQSIKRAMMSSAVAIADSSSSNKDANVRVFARVRPFNSRELGPGGGRECVRVADPSEDLDTPEKRQDLIDGLGCNVIVQQGTPMERTFEFDASFGPDSTQATVFRAAGQSLVEEVVKGFNATILAYGQTGSGKTYTVLGSDVDQIEAHLDHGTALPPNRGLLPRVFDHLFAQMKRQEDEAQGQMQFVCKCSFLEIYNEKVIDLLDPVAPTLNLRESMEQGVYVENQVVRAVTSTTEALEVMIEGNQYRSVGCTAMNRESSRSHSVFALVIETKTKDASGATVSRVSRFNLVDLAGSERQTMTGSTGVTLVEAQHINTSLLTLGRVIAALAEVSQGKTRHIHYRDSKLTFLLRDSLGGNSKTHVIANVSPAAQCYGETLSTLKFAQRAKLVRNRAVVNEDTTLSVSQLQKQVKQLRYMLQQQANNGSGGVSLSDSCLPMLMSGTELETDNISVEENTSRDEEMVVQLSEELVSAHTREQMLNKRLKAEVSTNAALKKALSGQRAVAKIRNSSLDRLRKQATSVDKPTTTSTTSKFGFVTTTTTITMKKHEEVTTSLQETLRAARAEVATLQEQVKCHPDVLTWRAKFDEAKAVIDLINAPDQDTDVDKIAMIEKFLKPSDSDLSLKLLTEELSTKLAAVIKEKQELTDRVKVLENAPKNNGSNELNGSTEEQQAVVNELTAQIESLTEQSRAAAIKDAEVRRLLGNSKLKEMELGGDLEELTSNNSTLHNENESLIAKVNLLERASNFHSELTGILEQSTSVTENNSLKNCADPKQELSALHSSLENMGDDAQKADIIKSRMDEFSARALESIKRMSEERDQLSEEVNQLNIELARMTKDCEKAEANAISSLADGWLSGEDVEKLNEKLGIAKKEIEQVQIQAQEEADRMTKVIESQVLVADQHMQEVETFHATVEQLADDMDTLASSNWQVETQLKERECLIEELKTSSALLKLNLQESERDVSDLNELLTATRARQENAAESESSKADMMRAIQHDLETSVQIHKDKARDADTRVRSLEQRLANVSARAASSEAEHEEAKRELEYLSSTYKTLADEVLRSQAGYTEAVETAEAEQARAMESQLQLKRIEHELKDSRIVADEKFQVMAERSANEKNIIQTQLQTQSEHMKQLKTSLAALSQEQIEQVDAICSAKMECQDLFQVVDTLQISIQATQAAKVEAEANARDKEQHVELLKVELNNVLDAANGFIKNTSSAREECEELKPLMEALETQMGAMAVVANSNVNGLQAELSVLHDRVRTFEQEANDQVNNEVEAEKNAARLKAMQDASTAAVAKAEELQVELDALQTRSSALATENAVLAGHGNPAQKIKHVVALKNQVERYRKSENAIRVKLDAAVRQLREAGLRPHSTNSEAAAAVGKSPRAGAVASSASASAGGGVAKVSSSKDTSKGSGVVAGAGAMKATSKGAPKEVPAGAPAGTVAAAVGGGGSAKSMLKENSKDNGAGSVASTSGVGGVEKSKAKEIVEGDDVVVEAGTTVAGAAEVESAARSVQSAVGRVREDAVGSMNTAGTSVTGINGDSASESVAEGDAKPKEKENATGDSMGAIVKEEVAEQNSKTIQEKEESVLAREPMKEVN